MKEYFERIRKMDPQDNYVELKVISGSAAGDKALYVNGQRIYAERDFFPLTTSSFDRSGTGILEMGDRLFYHERLCGKKKLVVCGAGHVGLAVARLGRFLEYAVTVIEDREEFAAKAKECGADHVMVCSSFARGLEEVRGDGDTSFVVVTRGHCDDLESMKVILRKDHAYAGLMGSRKKVEMLEKNLGEEGFSREALEQVHMPIGLKIGAQTPEEIAVSIMGEIIEVNRKRKRGYGYPEEILEALCRADRPAVLATVIRKAGSGPREPGAKMLVYGDGRFIGTVGGGMVEARTIRTAGEMLHRKDHDRAPARVISVALNAGTMEDGKGICGGRIDVLLEVVEA